MNTGDIQYERNFLTKVIFRLDFQPILKLQDQTPVEFQDRIRSRLPEFEEQRGFEFSSQISAQGKKDETIPLTNWIFRDQTRRYQLTLNFRFLAIEDSGYTSLDDLLALVTAIMSAFSEAYSDIMFTRIGLRYVNEIRLKHGDPFDWDGYIAPHLIQQLSGMMPHSHLARAMSQTVFNREDHLVVFNHGIFNSEFPSPISRREFILDLDASSADVAEKAVVDKVRDFNADLLEMFEASIGANLRREMGRKCV